MLGLTQVLACKRSGPRSWERQNGDGRHMGIYEREIYGSYL